MPIQTTYGKRSNNSSTQSKRVASGLSSSSPGSSTPIPLSSDPSTCYQVSHKSDTPIVVVNSRKRPAEDVSPPNRGGNPAVSDAGTRSFKNPRLPVASSKRTNNNSQNIPNYPGKKIQSSFNHETSSSPRYPRNQPANVLPSVDDLSSVFGDDDNFSSQSQPGELNTQYRDNQKNAAKNRKVVPDDDDEEMVSDGGDDGKSDNDKTKNRNKIPWEGTTRRTKFKSDAAHDPVLRVTKKYLLAQVLSGHAKTRTGPWPDKNPAELAITMRQAWLIMKARMTRINGVEDPAVQKEPTKVECRKVRQSLFWGFIN